MESAAKQFAEAIDTSDIAAPEIPVIGNVSAEPLVTADDVRADLRSQIDSPVRWYQSMDTALAKGVRRVVELGPGKILSAQLKRSHPDFELANMDEAAAIGSKANV
jgi:[acyl-carrier-protein] S-malonyltransferase